MCAYTRSRDCTPRYVPGEKPAHIHSVHYSIYVTYYCCFDWMPVKSSLRKGCLVLARSWRGHSPWQQEGLVVGVQCGWSHCTHRQEAERDECWWSAQFFPLFVCPRTPANGKVHPHPKWVFSALVKPLRKCPQEHIQTYVSWVIPNLIKWKMKMNHDSPYWKQYNRPATVEEIS